MSSASSLSATCGEVSKIARLIPGWLRDAGAGHHLEVGDPACGIRCPSRLTGDDEKETFETYCAMCFKFSPLVALHMSRELPFRSPAISIPVLCLQQG